MNKYKDKECNSYECTGTYFKNNGMRVCEVCRFEIAQKYHKKGKADDIFIKKAKQDFPPVS